MSQEAHHGAACGRVRPLLGRSGGSPQANGRLKGLQPTEAEYGPQQGERLDHRLQKLQISTNYRKQSSPGGESTCFQGAKGRESPFTKDPPPTTSIFSTRMHKASSQSSLESLRGGGGGQLGDCLNLFK